jgi:hypothetical protein
MSRDGRGARRKRATPPDTLERLRPPHLRTRPGRAHAVDDPRQGSPASPQRSRLGVAVRCRTPRGILRQKSPAVTGSTGAGNARRTMHSGASCSPFSAPMPAPAATSPAASTKASAAPRSSAASSDTSPARLTDTYHADNLQRRAWPNKLPDPAPRCVLRSTCRPVTATHADRLGLIRACPHEWPITGLPAPPEEP